MITTKTIKIIPLGGVEEIGINCTAIEYDQQIIVIDVGLGFPLSDQYGVDFIIPNIDYLKKNKTKIEGIIITHGHLDHIGGLPYVLADLDFPQVYASRIAIELISQKLQEFELLDKVHLNEVNGDSILASGDFQVQFFKVNHSIPEAMGVIIKTPLGNLVHTGDFKFDNTPVNEPVADYNRIAAIGQEGVLALLSDSTNSFKKGMSKSESVIASSLEEVIKDAKGRVIVATFASLLTRIQQLIKIAEKYQRKVLIEGRSMDNSVKIARKLGYIKVNQELFLNPKNKIVLPDNKVMILATGSQGEDMAALARMTRGEHRSIKIQKGDTVILSASIIPGNDMLVQFLVDEISQKGAKLYYAADDMNLHSSGHGFQEDQKMMINFTKPKYFIPVHGYQSFLYKHAETAESLGIPEKNIIIPRRGQIIEYDGKEFKKGALLAVPPILVAGNTVGEVGSVVMNDRHQLANYGVISIIVNIIPKSDQFAAEIKIISRGFVYEKQDTAINEQLEKKIYELLKNNKPLLTNNLEIKLKEIIFNNIRRFIFQKTQSEPLLLIQINKIKL
ncbi:MAG: ribonuclease J [bacterium]